MSEDVKTECYQCGKDVYELSIRSRCVGCEHQRGDFNEAENDRLRKAGFDIVHEKAKMLRQAVHSWNNNWLPVSEAIDKLKRVLVN
jgi:hypothetical protein